MSTGDGETEDTVGTERPCPDCPGRQVTLRREDGRLHWLCTDSHCDRIDRIENQMRYQTCEGCGGLLDTHEAGVWKAPNDEQWWHEGCYDKIEKAEEIAGGIRTLMTPEHEYDGLSDDFHDSLDDAQATIFEAAKRERVRQEQKE